MTDKKHVTQNKSYSTIKCSSLGMPSLFNNSSGKHSPVPSLALSSGGNRPQHSYHLLPRFPGLLFCSKLFTEQPLPVPLHCAQRATRLVSAMAAASAVPCFLSNHMSLFQTAPISKSNFFFSQLCHKLSCWDIFYRCTFLSVSSLGVYVG